MFSAFVLLEVINWYLKTNCPRHSFYHFFPPFTSGDIFSNRFYSRLGFFPITGFCCSSKEVEIALLPVRLWDGQTLISSRFPPLDASLQHLWQSSWAVICFEIILANFCFKGIENLISLINAAKTIFVSMISFHRPFAIIRQREREHSWPSDYLFMYSSLLKFSLACHKQN